MRRVVGISALALAVALSVTGTVVAVLDPDRTVTSAGPVTALSVTRRAVVFAVGETARSCGAVRLWDTTSRGLWTFGERTILGCDERPSGGFGIPAVSTTGRRAFWLTRIGGNFTDWQLWTATPTRRAARRLAFASAETERPPPIVLGAGTAGGVPYAVRGSVTYVSDSGARLFRVTLPADVRLLTSGPGAGAARVVAALADGSVVLLSGTGAVLRTDSYERGAVRAIALGAAGPLVQVGRTVGVGALSGGTKVSLPAGAVMLDHREGRIVYRTGIQVRARRVATGEDARLVSVPVKPWQPMLFSTDWGSAWASGRAVAWRSGPLG